MFTNFLLRYHTCSQISCYLTTSEPNIHPARSLHFSNRPSKFTTPLKFRLPGFATSGCCLRGAWKRPLSRRPCCRLPRECRGRGPTRTCWSAPKFPSPTAAWRTQCRSCDETIRTFKAGLSQWRDILKRIPDMLGSVRSTLGMAPVEHSSIWHENYKKEFAVHNRVAVVSLLGLRGFLEPPEDGPRFKLLTCLLISCRLVYQSGYLSQKIDKPKIPVCLTHLLLDCAFPNICSLSTTKEKKVKVPGVTASPAWTLEISQFKIQSFVICPEKVQQFQIDHFQTKRCVSISRTVWTNFSFVFVLIHHALMKPVEWGFKTVPIRKENLRFWLW